MSLSSQNFENSETIQLIHDVSQIKRFEEICQKVLQSTPFVRPAMLINLSVRSKYENTDDRMTNVSGKNLNGFFQRKLYTKGNNLANMIGRLEVKHGLYLHKLIPKGLSRINNSEIGEVEEIPMDNNMLSVYFCINPRDQVLALHKQYTHVMNLMLKAGDKDSDLPKKFDSDFLTHIHKCDFYKVYIDVDIDTKDKDIIKKIFELCPDTKNVDFAIETRGGYHFIFRKENFPKEFYRQVVQYKGFEYEEVNRIGKNVLKKYVDVNSDVCIPVPGTYQGGFPVNFIRLEDLLSE